MEEEPQNQAPSTWVCLCRHVNKQDHTTCEICGLPSPAAQDHIQPQHPSQSIDQPSPQIEEEPSPQIEEEPSPQIDEEEAQSQDQSVSSQPQGVAGVKNVYDHGPVQIVATVPNTGDLVPKNALRKVIPNFNREAQLVIISQLGIINQGKSLYGNVLNHRLLNGGSFTPFPVGTTTKGLNIFSNPLPLKDDPNTQIVSMDVEGAYGLTNEPPEIQALGLKRLYTLSMLLSSVVVIHLGEKPAQSEISLLNEASETVLLIKSKFYLDLPKIYLLIKEAEDNENYKASIEDIRQRLQNQLNPEIMQHIEILPRGKLSDAFLTSDPLDYSKVDQGYLAQMDKIIGALKDHKKKHPILANQPFKISDFPSIIKELGVGILNNKEYGPYLERSFDYLRSQELNKACQKHLSFYTEECKARAEDPNNLVLTTEQFTEQLNNAIQTKHRANFLQEAETIMKKKLGESPLLQSFMSQFDTGMKIRSFENVFIQKKLEKEQQQAEKEKYQKRQQEIAQQQKALQEEAQRFEQERQRKAEEHKQDMDKWNASHHQLIQQYKAQREQEMARLQEQQKQRQQQMEAETAQANANQQEKAKEYENQQAQLKKQIDEEQKKREEDQRKREEGLKKAQQENQQKMEEEKAQIDQNLAETQKNAEEQEQKRQDDAKKQQEQQAQEQAQMQQQIQEASQDDGDDDSDGGCCNIF